MTSLLKSQSQADEGDVVLGLSGSTAHGSGPDRSEHLLQGQPPQLDGKALECDRGLRARPRRIGHAIGVEHERLCLRELDGDLVDEDRVDHAEDRPRLSDGPGRRFGPDDQGPRVARQRHPKRVVSFINGRQSGCRESRWLP